MAETKAEKILILAVETSCDETSAAVVENGERSGQHNLVPNRYPSEVRGVVPEIASAQTRGTDHTGNGTGAGGSFGRP